MMKVINEVMPDGRIILNRKAILKRDRGHWLLRRTQDILFSSVALILLIPCFLIVMLLIWIDDPSDSPIFKQIRCGRDGRPFWLYKFRTMSPNAEKLLDKYMSQNMMDGPVFKMKDDPRVTKIGKILRKTSIDELPQFINVLRGDMSLVGPRPGLPAEVEKYTEYQRQRLYITPGLTCYWQIQPKRNELSFDEWVALDIQYIIERNWKTDWKIILRTAGVMLRGEGM